MAVVPLTTKYIYISTDSTYNASGLLVDQENAPLNNESLLYEIYDKFPAGIPEDCAYFKDSSFLKNLDSYGYKKLQCEDFFRKNLPNLTSLRLPDVIGPFDDTKRVLKYVTWFQTEHISAPIGFEDKDLKKKLSLVYSVDVIKVILRVLDQP